MLHILEMTAKMLVSRGIVESEGLVESCFCAVILFYVTLNKIILYYQGAVIILSYNMRE